MDRKDWYLLAYDIADPRRLKRVHYRMRREGVPVQESVFLVQRNRRGMDQLLDMLAKIMVAAEDDVRAYPIADPADIWMRGKGIARAGLLADAHLTAAAPAPGQRDQPARAPVKPGWWRGLLGAGRSADRPAPARAAAGSGARPAAADRPRTATRTERRRKP
jgi:CRISPR-associated protein Cas2